MTHQERFELRLKELPADQLAQILIQATKDNIELRKELFSLIAEPKDLVTKVKSTLIYLRGLEQAKKRLSEEQLANRIQETITDIARIADQSADEAFALLCALLTTQCYINQEYEDQEGFVKKVFRGPLMKCAQSIAPRCRNEKGLVASLLKVVKDYELEMKLNFIDAVVPTLPEDVVRKTMNYIELYRPQNVPADSFRYGTNIEMHKRCLVALGEIEDFKHLCTSTTGLHAIDQITIAEMYCDHDEYDKAQECLRKISTGDRKVANAHKRLRHRIYENMSPRDRMRKGIF